MYSDSLVLDLAISLWNHSSGEGSIDYKLPLPLWRTTANAD